ncbi:hypothetical protein [Teredinibacter purpureus]|uniref:hypothetical protein n=1 Tax=Teredinibacter purpureus TaxID=2731756 RepID=UPI0005F88750|nr:hypothetical protein [Teredinibacter purpureus]
MKNNNIKFHILTLFAVVFSSAACATKDVVVRVPVLQTCEVDVRERLISLPKKVGIEAVFLDFDRTLQSHPFLVGYIELSSSKYSKDHLVTVANGIIKKCSISRTLEFVKRDSGEGEALMEFIRSTESVGKNLYILNEAEVVRVLF